MFFDGCLSERTLANRTTARSRARKLVSTEPADTARRARELIQLRADKARDEFDTVWQNNVGIPYAEATLAAARVSSRSYVMVIASALARLDVIRCNEPGTIFDTCPELERLLEMQYATVWLARGCGMPRPEGRDYGDVIRHFAPVGNWRPEYSGKSAVKRIASAVKALQLDMSRAYGATSVVHDAFRHCHALARDCGGLRRSPDPQGLRAADRLMSIFGDLYEGTAIEAGRRHIGG
jgi:hypothetical protein